MKPENREERRRLIQKIGLAERADDYREIKKLGKQLMDLEDKKKIGTKNRKFDLTIAEYWSYHDKGFKDKEIAAICEASCSTLSKFKRRNHIVTERGIKGELPKEVIHKGF